MTKKIMFLTGYYGTGGKEKQLTELIKHLPEKSYESYLLVKNTDNFYLKEIETSLKGFKNLDSNHFSPLHLLDLYYYVKSVNPDIVYSWSTLLSHMMLILIKLRLLNVKLINGSIRSAPCKKGISDYIESFLYSLYPVVVSNSESGLKAYNQFAKSGRFILRNGIDISKYRGLDKKDCRNKISLPVSGFIVSMIARLENAKDHLNFIKSAKLLAESNKDIYFCIVGEGANKVKLQTFIKKLNLEEKVIFLGKQDDINCVLTASDLTVLLSTNGESLSNAIIESLVVGRPVIASDFSGNREIIRNEFNGYLIENNNPARIAESIKDIKDNKDLYNKLCKNAKSFASENFSMQEMISSFERIIAS